MLSLKEVSRSFYDFMHDTGLLDPSTTPEQGQQQIQKLLVESFVSVSRGYLAAKQASHGPLRDFRFNPKIINSLSAPSGFKELIHSQKLLQDLFEVDQEIMVELYQLAKDKIHNKIYTQAADILLFALYLNPFVSAYWQVLACCWKELHKTKDALYAYTLAIAYSPDNVEFYRCAVRYCLELKEINLAKQLLEYGLSRHSSSDLEAMLAFVNQSQQ